MNKTKKHRKPARFEQIFDDAIQAIGAMRFFEVRPTPTHIRFIFRDKAGYLELREAIAAVANHLAASISESGRLIKTAGVLVQAELQRRRARQSGVAYVVMCIIALAKKEAQRQWLRAQGPNQPIAFSEKKYKPRAKKPRVRWGWDPIAGLHRKLEPNEWVTAGHIRLRLQPTAVTETPHGQLEGESVEKTPRDVPHGALVQ